MVPAAATVKKGIVNTDPTMETWKECRYRATRS